MKRKIGLMGCGTVARYGHLPALARHEGWEIAALFDPHEENLRSLGAAFGVRDLFTDEAAFLDSGLDVVTIASPAPCHKDNVLHAAERKLPILCEKPLATCDAEAAAMAEACRTAGVPLYVGFDYRFSSVSQTIRRLVAEEAIGPVRALRLIYIWNLHGRTVPDNAGHRVPNARRIGRMEEGGPLVDCGVHQIDLARWWLGADVERFAAHGAWVEDFEAPDHIWLHMDHAGGAHTMVEMSFSYGADVAEPAPLFCYELVGRDGLIRFDKREGVFELRTTEGTRTLEMAHEKNFEGMYSALAKALDTGEAGDLPTADFARETTRIATEATREAILHRGNARG